MEKSPYTHLTASERYHINLLTRDGFGPTYIARSLGRDKGTVSREIKRNSGQRGYRHKQAQIKAQERRAAIPKQQLNEFAWGYVEHLLAQEQWSPEQIHYGLTARGWADVPSAEHIYRHIYTHKTRLVKHLRGRKSYRKRYASGQQKRGKIPNRRDIDERPAIIETRERLGDMEGDTIIGKAHQGALLTVVERRSRYLFAAPLQAKTAASTAHACVEALQHARAHSITFDNGLEFAKHEHISQKLNVDIYFAKPYHSWERGQNENTNGLLRQYFPKSTNLKNVTNEQVQYAVKRLNNRPRKVLNWKTPADVWAQVNLRL